MENPGYEPAGGEAPPGGYQQDTDGDDAPPAYPQNPATYEGYSNIGVCAPAQEDPSTLQRDSSQPPPTFQDVPVLSEDEAREAFARFVSEHCCYGSAPVKKLTFSDLQSSSTYQYVLESFTETRSTEYVSQPYMGQVIISNGMPPPQPWDIMVQPVAMFKDEVRLIEIPNTAQVEMCTKCSGAGRKFCFSCSGRGRTSCTSCHGHGHHHHNNERHTCSSCHGSGWRRCFSCDGTGMITCRCCKGSGRLKWYLQLKVEFKNNRDDFFKKSEQIPDELLRKCTSKNIYTEQNIRVYPINNYHDQDINNASLNLVNTHASRFSFCRILLQRQQVNSIPVTMCKYKFNDKDYQYQVYGLDSKVYSPDYPRKCCCCSIL